MAAKDYPSRSALSMLIVSLQFFGQFANVTSLVLSFRDRRRVRRRLIRMLFTLLSGKEIIPMANDLPVSMPFFAKYLCERLYLPSNALKTLLICLLSLANAINGYYDAVLA